MDKWLIDIIEEIQASNDLPGIKRILVKISRHLGFSNVAYVIKRSESFTRSSVLFVSDYPSEWLKHYGERGYVNIDPVASHCFNSQIPYSWEGLRKHQEEEIVQFAGEAGEFELCDGISIGMPRFDDEVGLISLASDKELSLSSIQRQRIITFLNALQPFIHEKISQVTRDSQQDEIRIRLTERERACLVWVAEGKTAHDISTILTISEATVVFHLKNSIRKLNVSNRSQAIAKAILLGLITPQFSGSSIPTYYF